MTRRAHPTLDPVLDGVVERIRARRRRIADADTIPPPVGPAARTVAEVDHYFAELATLTGGR